MKITLELWDDQTEKTEEPNSSLWIMKLNGVDFPEGKNSLMTLDVAHKIVTKLMEIEDIAYNEL
jgi:hypothetical protein